MNNFKGCIFAFCIFFGSTVLAQPMTQAPELPRKVRTITEWYRTDVEAKGQRGGQSRFNRAGHLIHYKPAKDDYNEQRYYYDGQGRLKRMIEGSEQDSIVTVLWYSKGKIVKEQRFRGKVHRTVQFFRGGKKVEEKSYAKGVELGNRYLLKARVMYNYNKMDSLAGETHYAYPVRGKAKPQKRKVLHFYDPKSKLRSKTLEYDFDGRLRIESLMAYDARGRLSQLLHSFQEDGSQRLIEYKYKNGKIWQIIDDAQYKKVVSIFVNGRLIRHRSYLGDQLFAIVDYQYSYYN